jgi:hypothetical protein
MRAFLYWSPLHLIPLWIWYVFSLVQCFELALILHGHCILNCSAPTVSVSCMLRQLLKLTVQFSFAILRNVCRPQDVNFWVLCGDTITELGAKL